MSSVAVSVPLLDRNIPTALSNKAQVKQQLHALQNVNRDTVYVVNERVVPHGPEARLMDEFWIRRVSSLPKKLQRIRPLGSVVGINLYTPTEHRCNDHFQILAGAMTQEATLQAAAGLWRSLEFGAGTIPMVTQLSKKVTGMAHKGRQIQCVAWINRLDRDAKTGHAQGYVLDQGVEIFAMRFQFTIVTERVFDRTRKMSLSARERETEFQDRIIM